jgi:predicted nucleic-acid-binding Zn-ribbon protein
VTAKLAAYYRQFSDIAFAKEVAELIDAEGAFEQILREHGLSREKLTFYAPMFEARYKSITECVDHDTNVGGAMKASNTCPKCHGRKIWRIENVHVNSDLMGGRKFWLVVERKLAGEHIDAGAVDAFTCARCGFTEWYAHALENLVHDPSAGVHFLDHEDGKSGPYRG